MSRPRATMRFFFAPRVLATLSVVACLCAGAASAAPVPTVARAPHIVLDPHYGDTLFYFYQDKFFSAVTQLMVSQHFARLPHHSDEAELLRGGLFLSYGLHKEAGEIFTRLIDQGAAPSIRDRAWFYLAKIRYQRGLLPEGEQALAHVGNTLPGNLEQDRVLLHANLLMARGDFAGAVEVLEGLRSDVEVGRYARFNLGVAMIKSGTPSSGVAMLDALGQAPANSDELRALRDKANLALGFWALQENRPAQAREFLERVRLQGMLANKALLGFGWADIALNAPKRSLVAWTELAKRDRGDAAVLEAKLALPYAYAELGALAQAQQHYAQAIDDFEQEDKQIDESINAIRAGKLLDGLLERNPGQEMGWFWNIDQLPQMPHAAHLTQVLAQHEFQEAFKNYRDLRFLTQNLSDWQEKLSTYGDILTNRRLAFAQRLPAVSASNKVQQVETLRQQSLETATQLIRAESEGDLAAFADARERALAERIARLRAARNTDSTLAERTRRVAGALLWQQTQRLPERVWNAKKNQKALEAALVQAQASAAALARAQRDEPARFDALAARLTALDKQLHALQPSIAEATRAQQEYLQALAVNELVQQKERLVVYANQARFAYAQLFDRGSNKDGAQKKGDDAQP